MSADSFRHRKATAQVRVLKADGSPAAGQQVQIDQVSHQFLFGCGAFDAVAMMKTQDEKRHASAGHRIVRHTGANAEASAEK